MTLACVLQTAVEGNFLQAVDFFVLHDKVSKRNRLDILPFLYIQSNTILIQYALNLDLLLCGVDAEVTHSQVVVLLLSQGHPRVFLGNDQPRLQVLMNSDENTIIICCGDSFLLTEDFARFTLLLIHMRVLLQSLGQFFEFE